VQIGGGAPQIVDEGPVLPLLVDLILDAQQRRRMDGDEAGGAPSSGNGWPRSLPITAGRFSTLRAAVAPSITMTSGLIIRSS